MVWLTQPARGRADGSGLIVIDDGPNYRQVIVVISLTLSLHWRRYFAKPLWYNSSSSCCWDYWDALDSKFMVRYFDWPLDAIQFWGVREFGHWCCFSVQTLGQVRTTISLDYSRQYLNFAAFLWGVYIFLCWRATALRNNMYLDVSKKVLQDTYLTDGDRSKTRWGSESLLSAP